MSSFCLVLCVFYVFLGYLTQCVSVYVYTRAFWSRVMFNALWLEGDDQRLHRHPGIPRPYTSRAPNSSLLNLATIIVQYRLI